MYNNDSSSYHNAYRSLPSASTATSSVSGAWNGSSWVSTSTSSVAFSQQQPPPPALPSTDLPKTPSHMKALDPKTTPIGDLVTHFSAIYQHYSKQVATFKAQNDTDSSGYQWAEYYADLSTRAAHHYNDLLQKQKLHHHNNGSGGKSSYNINGQQQQTHHKSNTSVASVPAAPPKSFQEYAHRNLSRCVNETQKSAMTELIQLTIKKSMQNGSMHSTKWESEALLPLPGSNSITTPASAATSYRSNNSSSSNSLSSFHTSRLSNNNTSYNSSSSSSKINNGKSYVEALKGSRGSSSSISDANNYYGRQSSNDSGTTTSGKKRGIIDLTNSDNVSTSSSIENHKKLRMKSSYDNDLPINDSYYGSSRTESDCTKGLGSRSSSSPKEKFDQDLPANDSYYGRASSVGSGISNQGAYSNSENINPRSSPSKKTKTTNSSHPVDDKVDILSVGSSKSEFQFGDYISLSSLSTTKYVTKKNKLVKVNSSIEKNDGKKKKNVIKGAVTSNKSKLASRRNRFSGPGGIADATCTQLHSAYSQGTEQFMGKSVIGGRSKKLDEQDYESMTVKGTCEVLEKEYLRLTAPPRADLVRPQNVMQKHVRNLKNQWKQYREALNTGKVSNDKGKKKRRDYNWFCSQLKAIRQDLTVQRIFNAFAVEVYETHAKIALEEGDMNEYNQSQTQLKELYDILTHSGDDEALKNGLKNQNEFIAYRIIYYVFLTGNKKYDGGSSDLFKIMLGLTEEQRKNAFIKHALKVRIAVADNDYHSFFRLQDNCPNSGAYLMDMMIGQIRANGLQCMMKSYRPTISVAFVLEELGFAVNGEIDVDEGTAWLVSCGCKLSEDRSLIHAKESVLNESNLIGRKSSSLI